MKIVVGDFTWPTHGTNMTSNAAEEDKSILV